MSAFEMLIFGGQPSITTPMPPPCDSPKVVTRKSWPKVLPIARIVAQAFCLWGQRASRLLGRDSADETPACPTAETAMLLNRCECDFQILNQIAHAFDAHGQPDE